VDRSRTAVAAPPRPRAGASLGERVRELRRSSGLTQGDLAGGRFSKEYISQIETGKTRPTRQTVDFLAERLGVDLLFLESGFSSAEYATAQQALADAEQAVAEKRYADAVELLEHAPSPADAPELRLRGLLLESWSLMYLGELQPALDRLLEAQRLGHDPALTDADRAEVLYQMGCCRYKLSEIDRALGLLCVALTLAERSPGCDRLRAHILEWRSRCYRRYRDWEAAREDIERALELASSLSDDETTAHVYFQASLVAERSGSWVRARAHAERARRLYESIDDRVNVGRLLNNLGGLSFLLGNRDEAERLLKEAFALALESGSDADAAQAVSSLAQLHERSGEPAEACRHARHALDLLTGRVDFLDEVANARLVLGRSLIQLGQLDEAEVVLRQAEDECMQLSSSSHTAAAWTAQGDLAERRGDVGAAGRLYRRAAQVLQEVRF
jgi:tetratricopeptide (TPR) repeat protein